MILLIDGYNVIKQAISKSDISESEREAFIKKLGKYCNIKRHNARLVFDGGPSDRATKESLYGVAVIYSGYRDSADDYIKNYLDKNKALDLLLVSTDRDICRHAARLSIEQIDAKDFYYIMCEALKIFNNQVNNKAFSSKVEAKKTSDNVNEELDSLMKLGSKVVQIKLEDILPEDYFSGLNGLRNNKLTKKETKRFKKIKKL